MKRGPRAPYRRRRYSTRDKILADVRRMITDTLAQPPPPTLCKCDDCRLARARDVSEHPRVLQVTPEGYNRMMDLAVARRLQRDPDTGYHIGLARLTDKLFSKAPALLREVEAAAVIAHLERGDC